MITAQEIESLIVNALPGAQAKVNDPYNDGQHFMAVVVAEQFNGLATIKQHRLVNDAIKLYLDSGDIHALQLKTCTPAEWQQNQVQVG